METVIGAYATQPSAVSGPRINDFLIRAFVLGVPMVILKKKQ